jgi:hypothetical protein
MDMKVYGLMAAWFGSETIESESKRERERVKVACQVREAGFLAVFGPKFLHL